MKKLTSTWHDNRIFDERKRYRVFYGAESHKGVFSQSSRDVNSSQRLRGLDHHSGIGHRSVTEILPELGGAWVKDAIFFGCRGNGRVGRRPTYVHRGDIGKPAASRVQDSDGQGQVLVRKCRNSPGPEGGGQFVDLHDCSFSFQVMKLN